MVTPDFQKLFWLGALLIDFPAVLNGDYLIFGAVDDQLGAFN